MKTNIIFDFDGVIINSHRTKTEAFNKIFLNFGKKIGYKSRNFHLKNIGKSRYFKFKYVYKYFLKQNINKKIITELDSKFEKYTLNKIINMKISSYLLEFLNKKKKYNFYISTSTPKNKITEILKKKKLLNYFKKIYGAPQSKYQHVNSIKKNKCNSIFIGDSIEDFKVAKKSHIMFILKNNSENKAFRQKNKKIKKINSFKKFDKVISNILCRK